MRHDPYCLPCFVPKPKSPGSTITAWTRWTKFSPTINASCVGGGVLRGSRRLWDGANRSWVCPVTADVKQIPLIKGGKKAQATAVAAPSGGCPDEVQPLFRRREKAHARS